MLTFASYVLVGLVCLVAGWLLHRKFGAKADAVKVAVETAAK